MRDTTSRTVDQMRVDVGGLRSALNVTTRQADSAVGQLARALSDLALVRGALDDSAKLQDESATTMTNLENRTRELSAHVDSLRCSLELILGPTGRFMTRLITDDEVDALINDFDFADDREDVAVALHLAYRTLVELELRCVGRFAGSTPNILAKLAAVMLLPLPSSEVLEIGTLFGVGAVGVARQITRTGADARLTIVDPFAGYQIQPDRGADHDVSLTPVTQVVVATNLALGGVDADHYRLIEGRSDDADVQGAVADRRYGLIVIDGDHSREAALKDLIWAESVAERGALVVLDDVGDPAWPGVAEALEEYTQRSDSALELIGTAATSAFLRMPGSAEAG